MPAWRWSLLPAGQNSPAKAMAGTWGHGRPVPGSPVTRSLVAAGADVLPISESRHSLEDIYLELIDAEPEADDEKETSRT